MLTKLISIRSKSDSLLASALHWDYIDWKPARLHVRRAKGGID
jgi:hypothetical protein